MDKHILEHYSKRSDDAPQGHFHQVIALHQAHEVPWSEIQQKMPFLCKGWYELSRLKSEDRIEFTKEYWLSKFAFDPRWSVGIERFFNSIDDICLFLVQQKFGDPFEAHMIYSLKGDRGYYKGNCGISEEETAELQKAFTGTLFPKDYLAFLQVHNGFSKATDSGLFASRELRERFDQFQALVSSNEGVTTTLDELPIDPQNLIPFYESFGMPFFQCFWAEWYPEDEMGNVYYSGKNNTISILASKAPSVENMAFPTFMDWMLFYLEAIE